jgi:hypothetical protein
MLVNFYKSLSENTEPQTSCSSPSTQDHKSRIKHFFKAIKVQNQEVTQEKLSRYSIFGPETETFKNLVEIDKKENSFGEVEFTS